MSHAEVPNVSIYLVKLSECLRCGDRIRFLDLLGENNQEIFHPMLNKVDTR